MASSSRLRVSSSSEEDVARGTGVQPYRFEPRKRSNSGDEESAISELTLRYKIQIRELRTFRFLDVSPRTVIVQSWAEFGVEVWGLKQASAGARAGKSVV